MLKKTLVLILLSITVFSLPLLAAVNEAPTEINDNSGQQKSAEISPKEAESESAKTEVDLFTDGLNNYNQQNFSLAEESFQTLLEERELDEGLKFSVLYYSTMTAVRKNETKKAVSYLEKLNQLGFQSARLNWEIAELYLNKNNQFDSADFSQALEYLKKAEELGAESPQFKRDYAYAYLENQEIEKAEKLYNQIKEKKAADYLYLARIKENKGQLQQAVKYYESALELNSKQSSLYLNLANLYQNLDKHDSAAAVYKQGLKFKKDFAPYYIGLGQSYLALENYLEAEKMLKKAVEINENSYLAYFLLGNLAKEAENDNQALNYYSQALKYNPKYVEAFLAEGRIHLERKENYRAISRFSLAVEENPEHAESHYYLAKAYYAAEMLEAARSEFRRTLHLNDGFKDARKLLDEIEKELNID